MKNYMVFACVSIFALSALFPANAQNDSIEKEEEQEGAGSILDSLFGPSDFEVDYEEIAKHPLGSEGNPVRCDMPGGQRAYLARLRCAKNKRPQYERSGSTGMGPYGHIMDLYSVSCPKAEPVSVYMDMYHPGFVEAEAIPGFTIKKK
ncbi:MAG: hypothetical protein DHS20C05_22300 [Hyphococcus sp.]|nr:MAG: hypothetical protein DHS20C05_22300 [Marinicaulis sp.]